MEPQIVWNEDDKCFVWKGGNPFAWIPFGERWPPKSGDYLACWPQVRGGKVRIALYLQSTLGARNCWMEDGGVVNDPTHWMPMPALPYVEMGPDLLDIDISG